MANLVLGLGTSHTPLLSLPADIWPQYARADERNAELAYPPDGIVRPWSTAVEELKGTTRYAGPEPFQAQAARCQSALDTLASTLQDAAPDITIIISDDQDEWFFEHNMPRFAVYWGDSVPLIPRAVAAGASEMATRIAQGYGDVGAVMKGWMGSTGHRANIMDPSYTQMGSAAVWGNCDGQHRVFTVQEFMAS